MNRSTAMVGLCVLGFLALCYVIALFLPPVIMVYDENYHPGRFEGAWARAYLLAVLGLLLLPVILALWWCWRLLWEG